MSVLSDIYQRTNDHTFLVKNLNSIQTDPRTNISAWGFAPHSTWSWVGIGGLTFLGIVGTLFIISLTIRCYYKQIIEKEYADKSKSREERRKIQKKKMAYDHWRVSLIPFIHMKRKSPPAWEKCDENIYSQMIHKVLFEDNQVNWGPAIIQYGYGLFLNITSQFLLTFYLFFTSIVPRFYDLQYSQDKTFCGISSLLKFTALVIFLFNMFSKIEYFYKQVCIIFATQYRLKMDDDEYKVWYIKQNKNGHRMALFFICWMTEFTQWCFLLVCGMGYLLFADSVESLIMNSLSLDFILDIDEMIFKVLTPANHKSDQYEVALYNFPPQKQENQSYNFFQYLGLYVTSFCTKFIAPTLSILSIVMLDDYVGCSFCPNGMYCPHLNHSGYLINYTNSLRNNTGKPVRVLTSFDIVWPFIVVSFFVMNEIGRLISVFEHTCCAKKMHTHLMQRQNSMGNPIEIEMGHAHEL